MIVRTWNLFHGNTAPPGRKAYLREMIDLVTADRPAIVCLQEVPAWALDEVGRWASMRGIGERTRRGLHAVALAHKERVVQRFAQAAQNKPRGFLRDADLFGQLHGGDALAGGHNEVHGIEPFVQGDMRPLHHRPGAHSEVDIFSYGADGQPGGTGNDADIGSWAD